MGVRKSQKEGASMEGAEGSWSIPTDLARFSASLRHISHTPNTTPHGFETCTSIGGVHRKSPNRPLQRVRVAWVVP